MATEHTIMSDTPATSETCISSRRPLYKKENASISAGSISIDISSPFRLGTPFPLRKLPLINVGADPESKEAQGFERIEHKFMPMFLKTNSWTTMKLVRCVEPGDEPKESDHTIVILGERHPSWMAFLNYILEVLLREKISLRVEFIDGRSHLNSFRPVVSREFRDIWPRLEVELLTLLGTSKEWSTLNVVNRGHVGKESKPTIVIGITKAASMTWQTSVYSEISSLLGEFYEVQVEFVRSNLREELSGKAPPQALPAEWILDRVKMGSSIGSLDKSGTLGGYVRVFYEGKYYTMGLTCHHIISTEETSKDEETNGYSPSLNRSSPVIMSPSDADTNASLEQYEDDLRRCGGKFNGERAARDTKYCNHMEKWERGILQDISDVKTFNRRFGRIFASSGTGRYHKQTTAVDSMSQGITICSPITWALILIDDENRIPADGGSQIPPSKEMSPWGFRPLSPSIQFASREPRRGLYADVFKKGRSEWTMGTISEFKARLNMHDGRLCQALAVTGKDFNHTYFSRSGESGSLVLDGDGELQGYELAGGWRDKFDQIGYVIPIAELYEDIEKRTGAKIVSPVLVDD